MLFKDDAGNVSIMYVCMTKFGLKEYYSLFSLCINSI